MTIENMTHKVHIHVHFFPFSRKGDEDFLFFLVLVFFSKSSFLIMSCRDKGETNGGLIAETSKNQ